MKASERSGRIDEERRLCIDQPIPIEGPRQVRVLRQNSRRSLLFHFDVPGGKWQAVTCRPVSAARTASWSFHVWCRQSPEPPASQVTSSRRAPG